MNWMHQTVFLNTPSFLEELGHTMQAYDVKPEIEIFDGGMVYNSLYYLKKGVLKAPLHYQFVLGAAGGMAATIENLVFLKSLIPEGSTWSALGIGKGHVPIMLAAIAMLCLIKENWQNPMRNSLPVQQISFVKVAMKLQHHRKQEKF